MAKRRMFAERTPLGHQVVLTRDRWREIVRYKHPAMKDHEADVQDCLTDPDPVRVSEKDPDVHLYYRKGEGAFTCVVVAGPDPAARFVVTTYFTRKPKEGEDLWTK